MNVFAIAGCTFGLIGFCVAILALDQIKKLKKEVEELKRRMVS